MSWSMMKLFIKKRNQMSIDLETKNNFEKFLKNF